ncbi:MAG TPA: acyl-CoA dehydrogenase family protein, partial [Candidatus Sulfotelmatobacter sp.]|nr:acyl-CoA dehydrogenase family protein [Candidatus Sulfotelmatobacter sp.]
MSALADVTGAFDRSFHAWPFFEARHRSLARSLEAWTLRHVVAVGHTEASVDSATRGYVRALADAGWLAHAVPADGEAALDVRSLCLARETLAAADGLADFAFAMQGLGSAPISLFGTPRQGQAYLPAVRAGRKIAAFALSEAASGSDVASITTAARREGNGFVIDGEKTWISNAGIADFYVVFARTGEAAGARGLSAFVVDANTLGCTVTQRLPIIAPHPLGTVRFTSCRVDADSLIGAPGEGFKIAMATLDVFRASVGAAALGFARRALAEAVVHARARVVFGQPLAALQMTQGKLADMATAIDAAALLVYRAAWTKDTTGARVTREASMAKLFATEAAQQVIDEAVQIFGGHGVVSGNAVERLYREIRALRIYEGA